MWQGCYGATGATPIAFGCGRAATQDYTSNTNIVRMWQATQATPIVRMWQGCYRNNTNIVRMRTRMGCLRSETNILRILQGVTKPTPTSLGRGRAATQHQHRSDGCYESNTNIGRGKAATEAIRASFGRDRVAMGATPTSFGCGTLHGSDVATCAFLKFHNYAASGLNPGSRGSSLRERMLAGLLHKV